MSMKTSSKLIDNFLYKATAELPVKEICEEGKPYLERHFVGETKNWEIYLHRYVGSDPDRGLHNHPWEISFSFVLCGFYYELRRCGIRPVRWFNIITADTLHRVILPPNDQVCWTLFFRKKADVQDWGFVNPVDELLPGESWAGKPLLYIPFQYNGGRKSNPKWWLTAPKAKDIRKSKEAA